MSAKRKLSELEHVELIQQNKRVLDAFNHSHDLNCSYCHQRRLSTGIMLCCSTPVCHNCVRTMEFQSYYCSRCGFEFALNGTDLPFYPNESSDDDDEEDEEYEEEQDDEQSQDDDDDNFCDNCMDKDTSCTTTSCCGYQLCRDCLTEGTSNQCLLCDDEPSVDSIVDSVVTIDAADNQAQTHPVELLTPSSSSASIVEPPAIQCVPHVRDLTDDEDENPVRRQLDFEGYHTDDDTQFVESQEY